MYCMAGEMHLALFRVLEVSGFLSLRFLAESRYREGSNCLYREEGAWLEGRLAGTRRSTKIWK